MTHLAIINRAESPAFAEVLANYGIDSEIFFSEKEDIFQLTIKPEQFFSINFEFKRRGCDVKYKCTVCGRDVYGCEMIPGHHKQCRGIECQI